MNAYFVEPEQQWFLRGGSSHLIYDTPANGLLAFHTTSETPYDWYSSRVVVGLRFFEKVEYTNL